MGQSEATSDFFLSARAEGLGPGVGEAEGR